jgi:1-deoxy-D-xylulose-5-phosphate reductoisomerase
VHAAVYSIAWPHQFEDAVPTLDLRRTVPTHLSAPDHAKYPALVSHTRAGHRWYHDGVVPNAANEAANEMFRADVSRTLDMPKS